MCEWCGKFEMIEIRPLEPGKADGLLCEDESSPSRGAVCGVPARFSARHRVLEHICERHMRERKEALVGEFAELVKALGLAETIAAKPIAPGVACNDMDLDTATECGSPAAFAFIATQEIYLCAKHESAWK